MRERDQQFNHRIKKLAYNFMVSIKVVHNRCTEEECNVNCYYKDRYNNIHLKLF